MTVLELSDLSVRRQAREVLSGISVTLRPGECVGLVGPNGAGKTTLMRAALGLLPHEGRSSLAILPQHTRARTAAWLPQMREIAWPVSVETVVGLGRTPHFRTRPAAQDRAAVADALARMGLAAYAERTALRLSGGEQARVLIARALAQEAPVLLADEPIAGLDPAHQLSTMRIFADLAGEGRVVLVSLHDLGLAARFCTRLLLLSGGRLVADGPPGAVLTPQNLAHVFGVRAFMAETPDGPVFQPLEVVEID
ncbi:iron complex transport system ATP-binding protein [Rhodovulum imhoffii]|uniref:Iron complex transport system ATP-binding protein n=1 Tax=Rhodovulum imhoffii TaxID=365340 RepID=A0A2T5BWL4_9RHOB|nr:ABC transporter ATP-binding protein [Rhodovulum imhoffii]PTN04029.1 iron complex transport system ATP-binding protein [Rhodovulum imhoffii]